MDRIHVTDGYKIHCLHMDRIHVTDGYRIHVYIWIGYMLRMDIGYMFTYVITRNQPNTYCTVASALTVTVFFAEIQFIFGTACATSFCSGIVIAFFKN